jgi:hypothetical protein
MNGIEHVRMSRVDHESRTAVVSEDTALVRKGRQGRHVSGHAEPVGRVVVNIRLARRRATRFSVRIRL